MRAGSLRPDRRSCRRAVATRKQVRVGVRPGLTEWRQLHDGRVDWLLSGILERFPNLKVMLSEGGAGWIPYILERADKAFHDKRIKPNASIGQTSKGGLIPPSQLSREHMFVCLVDELRPDLKRAPGHGEHTEEVLLELGRTWTDRADLKAAEAIN